MNFLIIFLSVLTIFFYSCKQVKTDSTFDVTDFNPLSNFETQNDTLSLVMDIANAITDGIEIPSVRQSDNGYFKIKFNIVNHSDKPRKFYYKLFYQNESYKFRESYSNGVSFTYDKRSGENFYGSWIDPSDSLHVTELIPDDSEPHLVTDSFRILGNPRNEMRYFGTQRIPPRISNEIFDNKHLITLLFEPID